MGNGGVKVIGSKYNMRPFGEVTDKSRKKGS